MAIRAVTKDVAGVTAQPSAAAEGNITRTVDGIKESVAASAAAFGQTQTRVKEGMDKMMKTAEEMVSFGQGNVEAFVKSGQIWAAGIQDLTKQMAASTQAAMDESVSGFKALTGVKSFKEAIELQTSFGRAAFERALSETGRFTEASLKLAEQTAAPLAARVTLAVEKLSKTA